VPRSPTKTLGIRASILLGMRELTNVAARDVLLRDGSTLRIRGVSEADAAGLRDLYARLSSESLQFRFFTSPHRRTTDSEVARMVSSTSAAAFGVVAEAAGVLRGVASYARGDDPAHAEVAFAIADGWQGRGIGTRLLETLADVARESGIAVFDAYVLCDNTKMLDVFQASGFTIRQRLDAGVFHVQLSLDATTDYRQRSAARSQAAAAASLTPFFEPRAVAVVGANRVRGRIGSEVLHNLVAGGYTGRLVAVHPEAAAIDGVPAVPRVADIPGAIDLAVICVPAALVAGVVDDCIAKGVRALVVISAGFGETDAAGRAREADLVARVRHAGIRLIGPNCMGVLNTDPAVRLNATFAPVGPPAGPVAFSTQSGALGLAILDYAQQLHIGLSTFVSVGNKADVSGNDLIQYWETDPRTRVILLYLESFGNPRKFTEIARRVARHKPIAAVKAGRSAAGARAASSHTGALAARDAVVDALFQQAGVIRTDRLEELFDVAALLANQPIPRGRRVAILTNAGGPAILAADACEANGLTLPALSEATTADLRSFLPPAASVANPVDMIASASADQYARALGALLADDRVDSVLVIFIPPLVTEGRDVAAAIHRSAAAQPAKPVLAIFMSTAPAPQTLDPIPCFRFPEGAAVALARVSAYGEWLQRPEESPRDPDGFDAGALRGIVEHALARGEGWLPPGDAQRLLEAAGIRTARAHVAADEDAAVAAAETIGYPVAMKAIGPALVHKTEARAIRLSLADAAGVRDAWRDLADRLGDRMTGALVQEMVTGGVEMLVGAVEDPTFGPVIACAIGGTLTELIADSQVRLHPLTGTDAQEMIGRLRGAALLRGYRGAPAADEPALRDTLLRVSALVGRCPEILELDINPLLVRPHGVCALDVRVRVERPRMGPPTRRIAY
jgi:acetyl coenzyme A synthetase (ADP forming)-like protein